MTGQPLSSDSENFPVCPLEVQIRKKRSTWWTRKRGRWIGCLGILQKPVAPDKTFGIWHLLGGTVGGTASLVINLFAYRSVRPVQLSSYNRCRGCCGQQRGVESGVDQCTRQYPPGRSCPLPSSVAQFPGTGFAVHARPCGYPVLAMYRYDFQV